MVWKEIAGKRLTEKQVGELIDKGKTRLLKGFVSASGEPFAARLKLNATFAVVFDISPPP